MAILPDLFPGATKVLEYKNLVSLLGDAKGVTVHYTASRDLESTHKALVDAGLNYHFIIDRNGDVIQTAPMTASVYHAGRANWLGHSPNRSHVAISVISWGHCSAERETWAGNRLPKDDLVFRKEAWWDKCLMKQEEALLRLCQWLVCQGIPPAHYCGHDECCLPFGRKVDPGGALSFTMAEFRRLLISVQS